VRLQEIYYLSNGCCFPSRRGYAECSNSHDTQKYTITGGPDHVIGEGWTSKCHMSGCAEKAQTDKSAGFCLADKGDCWLPSVKNSPDSFLQEAAVAGPWMESHTNCDSEIEGGKNMMACYRMEDHNDVWSAAAVDFSSYEKFRAAVPGLTNWNYVSMDIWMNECMHPCMY
jgi:hypothetical protein